MLRSEENQALAHLADLAKRASCHCIPRRPDFADRSAAGGRAAFGRAPSYEQVMNQLSQTFLDKRHAVMDGIRAQEQAQSRQAWVGATVVKLLGGLPGNHDPDAAFRGQFDRVFRAHQALGWHGRLFIPPALPIELLIVLPGK